MFKKHGKMLYIKFISIVIVFVCVDSASLPSYLKACSLSDSDLNICALENARTASSIILKGDSKLKISELDPMYVEEIDLLDTDELHIKFMKCKIYGFKNAEVKEVKIDPSEQTFEVKIYVPTLSLIADYDIHGKLLVLPIEGQGSSNITAYHLTIDYNTKWNIREKKGKQYGEIEVGVLHYDVEQVFFSLENLFNGDPTLGKEVNNFLNENWSGVLNDVGGGIQVVVSSMAHQVVAGFFDNIPYDTLFVA